MSSARRCLICGEPAPVAYPEKIDTAQVSAYTYSSRKRPELMHYEYRECRDCRLLFSSSIPDVGDLLSAYHDANFDSPLESKYAAQTYADTLGDLIGPEVRVLDVGCGDGTFLAECAVRGVTNLQGIEPSPAAADLAPNEIRSRIFLGGHEEFDTSESFDLITLFQTIEHIRDPIGFFRSMSRLASPGAHFAVACHDYLSAVNRFLGEKSPVFDIEHLQIFSKRAIRKAMEAAGFVDVSVHAYANRYPLSYWIRLAPMPDSLKDVVGGSRSPIAKFPVTLPVGNIMAVGRFSGETDY